MNSREWAQREQQSIRIVQQVRTNATLKYIWWVYFVRGYKYGSEFGFKRSWTEWASV